MAVTNIRIPKEIETYIHTSYIHKMLTTKKPTEITQKGAKKKT